MKRLKVAVVGVGHLGRIHARLLAQNDRFDLVGVVDPDAEARQRVADECNAPPYADHGGVIDDVSAVVIAAPTRLHHSIGQLYLERGIHVLMEKPLAASTVEADELVESARGHNAVLQVGHVERFNPAFSSAVPHARDPKYIDASRFSPFRFRSTDIGAVFDLMIHDIDLILSLVRSPVRSVDALGVSIFGRLEDVANARIEFENGCVATLNASRASYVTNRKMQIWTADGCVVADFGTRAASLVRPAQELLNRQFYVDHLTVEQIEHYKDHLFDDLLKKETLPMAECDQLTAEHHDFADSITTGRQPRVTGSEGRNAVAVAEAILDEIATHQWDGRPNGRIGPLAVPSPSVIPSPHWHLAPQRQTETKREAG